MPIVNENRIKEKRCPVCGAKRPLDWFGQEVKLVEREKESMRVKGVIRYRKYVACWRCRELGRNTELASPPRSSSAGE